jgi:hypothetical protein
VLARELEHVELLASNVHPLEACHAMNSLAWVDDVVPRPEFGRGMNEALGGGLADLLIRHAAPFAAATAFSSPASPTIGQRSFEANLRFVPLRPWCA